MIRTISMIAIMLMAMSSVASAHGGGCRKSSPPGKCCHADNSNGGRVHCHWRCPAGLGTYFGIKPCL